MTGALATALLAAILPALGGPLAVQERRAPAVESRGSEETADSDGGSQRPSSGAGRAIRKGRRPGFDLGDEGERFHARVWFRGQFRFSDPFDEDPKTVEALESPPDSDLDVRRGRLKVEGHLFHPRVGFYFEHELAGDRPLLDLRLDVEVNDGTSLRIGQYKVLYNRERIDSSGKQQFVERSIATRPFTVDRQRGVTLFTHWAEGTRGENRLYLGIFEGDSRDPGPRGDDPMLVARWQWHLLGRPLSFSQSDLDLTEAPTATLSLAGARVRGPYTRFSSSGGGQLDGFELGGDERYTLEQWQQGFAWRHRGWSAQQELHTKHIRDHEAGATSKLVGGYAAAGRIWLMPLGDDLLPLELAVRYARVEWRDTPFERDQEELTVATNLFLSGHDNKVTLEMSRLEIDDVSGPSGHDVRFRIQWDVSF